MKVYIIEKKRFEELEGATEMTMYQNLGVFTTLDLAKAQLERLKRKKLKKVDSKGNQMYELLDEYTGNIFNLFKIKKIKGSFAEELEFIFSIQAYNVYTEEDVLNEK